MVRMSDRSHCVSVRFVSNVAPCVGWTLSGRKEVHSNPQFVVDLAKDPELHRSDNAQLL